MALINGVELLPNLVVPETSRNMANPTTTQLGLVVRLGKARVWSPLGSLAFRHIARPGWDVIGLPGLLILIFLMFVAF